MSKLSFFRVKKLFLAACARFYTDRSVPAMPRHRLQPRSQPFVPIVPLDEDPWLFAPRKSVAVQARALSQDMEDLAAALTGVRATLALMHTHAPRHETASHTRLHPHAWHDSALFDGEPLSRDIWQDTVMTDESAFLFQETSDQSAAIQQAA